VFVGGGADVLPDEFPVVLTSEVSVADIDSKLDVLDKDELLLVDDVPVVVAVLGKKPPCHAMLSPVAVPRLTTFASREASSKATVREVVGHQQVLALVTVLVPRFASQATHSFEVPLQYARPTHESSSPGQYEMVARTTCLPEYAPLFGQDPSL
jgi:hypothetical protein